MLANKDMDHALQRLVELAKETNQDQIKIEIVRIYADEGNPHFNLENACHWYREVAYMHDATVELLGILRSRYEGNFEQKLLGLSTDIDLEAIKKPISFIPTTQTADLVYYNSLLGLFFIEIEQLEQASEFFAKTIVGKVLNNVQFLDKAYQSLMPSEGKYDFIELASCMMDEIIVTPRNVC